MAPLVIPPIKSPIAHPRKQPLVLPPQLDPSCVLCLLPLRDDKWYDHSGNRNHGTLVGSTWSAKGQLGPGLTFDGLDDYVDCRSENLNITDAITVEAWVKPHTCFNNFGTIVGRKSVVDGYWFALRSDTTTLYFYLEGVANYYTGSGKFTLNEWQYFAATYDKDGGINNLNVYVNGVVVGTETETGGIGVSTENLHIGAGRLDNYYLNGIIDEVRIYNRALTVDEIKVLYEARREVRS